MADIVDHYIRGASIAKLNQNQKTMKSMTSTIVKSTVENLEQKKTIQELEDEIRNSDFSYDSIRTHLDAEQAKSDYLMDLLDQAYGVEKNPARQIAHPGREFRIPSGDRKGEEVTKADEVYLNRFAESFKEHYVSKWGNHFKTWIEFLSERISY